MRVCQNKWDCDHQKGEGDNHTASDAHFSCLCIGGCVIIEVGEK